MPIGAVQQRPAASTNPPQPPTVRVGVLGAGEQAVTHLLPALQRLPKATVTALVDPAVSRRAAVADRLNVPGQFDTVDELIASGLVDCVVAACPPAAHETIAAAAIAAGLPVFVEKPPSTSTGALAALAAAADRGGVLTGVGMNFRWAEPLQRLAAMLADGKSGMLSHIGVRHVASKPTQPMWGMDLWRTFLYAQAIHPIDLAGFLAGAPVERVRPLRRVGRDGILLSLHLEYTNGVTATVLTGNQAPRFEHRVEITTTRGVTASVDSLRDLTVAEPAAGERKGFTTRWQPSVLDVGYHRTGFGGELAGFLHAVATGGRFGPSFADLLPTYRIMDELTAGVGR